MIQYTNEMTDYIGSKNSKLKVFIDKYRFVETGIEGDIFSSIVFQIIGQMLSSQKVLAKDIILDNLYTKTDEELITYLTKVNGIGRWTAEMLATFL